MKRINLALQGGGAHGAFTWGVLDRLLQEDDIEIAAISGTSAGALNAAALKAGMVQDGRAGGRAALDALWHRIGAVHDLRLTGWIAQALPPVGGSEHMGGTVHAGLCHGCRRAGRQPLCAGAAVSQPAATHCRRAGL